VANRIHKATVINPIIPMFLNMTEILYNKLTKCKNKIKLHVLVRQQAKSAEQILSFSAGYQN